MLNEIPGETIGYCGAVSDKCPLQGVARTVNEDLKQSHKTVSAGLQTFLGFSALLVLCLFNLFSIAFHLHEPHHEGMNTRMTLMEQQFKELEASVEKKLADRPRP